MQGKFRFIPVLAGVLLIALQPPLFPQDFKRGAILDEAVYNNLPRKAELLSRAYTALPAKASLKQYAPFPGDQTDYGSCVAWASAYAARTISESIAVNRRDRIGTTGNVFSPAYIYKNITDDPECQEGAQISWALDFFKTPGAARMVDTERKTDFRKVDVSLYAEEKKYPIADYVILFDRDADNTKNSTKITKVKKSLAEGKPVIIGMNTPDSFINAKNVWQPRESGSMWYGGHAMCVIGYDDDMEGG
jgi:C1A family cysteine protease